MKIYICYLTLIVLLQVMIGAYLSTSYHRAACDMGFYKGWPLCQNSILPTLKKFGIILNYGHRLSAVVVGGLFYYVWKELRKEFQNSETILIKIMNIGVGFYVIKCLCKKYKYISKFIAKMNSLDTYQTLSKMNIDGKIYYYYD